ncbi:MAG: metallophosphoesterase [Actinomycetota bacterium]|nr:metallophosphoesterase [Actinomycetota bacterium]
MIRVAAVADVHFGEDTAGTLRGAFEALPDHADVLCLAGDFTRTGSASEASFFAEELRGIPVPMVAVLGNHDYHSGEEDQIADALTAVGVAVLERDSVVVDTSGGSLGIAGAKGFGGGFAGACATEFGEVEMKAFVSHTKEIAGKLHHSLDSVDGDLRIALLHYSPIEETLRGERPEIYPFLGSYHLAEAVDAAGADVVLHGHAHAGSERGMTPGGIHVRNVALPVIGRPYNIYCIGNGTDVACDPPPASRTSKE